MLMLPILMYHKVDTPTLSTQWRGNYVLPDQFEAQLQALRTWGYTTITLEDWLDFRASRRKPPRRPIAITFDDGYLSNLHIAWPILRRQGAVATIFVVTDCIGQTNHWDADQPQEPLLSVADIVTMQQGGICFGSHTCTHRSLIDLSPEDALSELTVSKTRLEALTGQPVTILAYPYNKQNSVVRDLARQAGYRAALLGRGRINASWTSPWALRRIRVDLQTTTEQLRHMLNRLRWFPGI